MKAALAQAQALIESGFAAQSAGHSASASQAYERALRLVPEHPTALQLLGLLRRREGDLSSAHDLMRRSLAVNPRQPHVWNNLANTLEELGKPQEALQCLDQALQLQADYAQAHYNRARLLRGRGQNDAALDAVRAAISHSSQPTPEHWQLLAQITDALSGPQAACDVLAEGLAHIGEDPSLLHDHAVLLQRLGRHEQALAGHERALSLGLQVADAYYNCGNTLQSLGRLSEAESAYLKALERAPTHHLAHYDLARLLWRQARADWIERLTLAATGARSEPNPQGAAHLLALQAQLLWRAEMLEEARAAYEAAWELSRLADHLDGVARCAVRLGEVEAGLQMHRQALELNPESASLLASHASSLMVAGRIHEALDPATQAVQAAPLDQYAWALLSTVYRITHPDRARLLLDPALIQVVDLSPPPGHADMAAFNQALLQAIDTLHRDRQAPLDQTLRGGTQTLGNLFDLDLPLVQALRQVIAQAIDSFVARLGREEGHPLRARNTGYWRFTDSWSSRLHSRGQHTNHVHPHGWISAVYYVEVPAVCADAQDQQGWLRFGEPDVAMSGPFPSLSAVQPRPGRLALFPSYWWHGTAPFESPETRTTIAFDVLPTSILENPVLHG